MSFQREISVSLRNLAIPCVRIVSYLTTARAKARNESAFLDEDLFVGPLGISARIVNSLIYLLCKRGRCTRGTATRAPSRRVTTDDSSQNSYNSPDRTRTYLRDDIMQTDSTSRLSSSFRFLHPSPFQVSSIAPELIRRDKPRKFRG